MSAAVLAAWAESAHVEEHVVEYLAGVIDDGVDQIRDSATLQVGGVFSKVLADNNTS